MWISIPWSLKYIDTTCFGVQSIQLYIFFLNCMYVYIYIYFFFIYETYFGLLGAPGICSGVLFWHWASTWYSLGTWTFWATRAILPRAIPMSVLSTKMASNSPCARGLVAPSEGWVVYLPWWFLLFSWGGGMIQDELQFSAKVPKFRSTIIVLLISLRIQITSSRLCSFTLSSK